MACKIWDFCPLSVYFYYRTLRLFTTNKESGAYTKNLSGLALYHFGRAYEAAREKCS